MNGFATLNNYLLAAVFGGDQAHKAFALAVGLQLFVDALLPVEGHGAVLVVAPPEADPVPAPRPAPSPDDCTWCGLAGGHRDVRGRLLRPRYVHT